MEAARAHADQLVVRYQTLDGALSAFDAAGGEDRDVSKDLHAALDAWTAALRDGDADSQVRAANRVEAQGTRLVANGLGLRAAQADPAVVDSLAKFADHRPERASSSPRTTVPCVRTRTTGTAPWRYPVARVLGFDARPVLALGHRQPSTDRGS